jgi:N-acetyl-gamma-glutamyl-phosphate reductase
LSINKGGTASPSSFKGWGAFIIGGFNMVGTAILGATGYTGSELVRLLDRHPEAKLVFISSESNADEDYSAVHPQFRKRINLQLNKLKVTDIPASVDLVFCALPHGKSASIVAALLERGLKVIDLSADFRLKDPTLYDEWYSLKHPFPALLDTSVYGLPELYSREIKSAKLIANPGCYPTSIILALAPLLSEGLVLPEAIIIDSKSGVSGAGRAPKQPFHFPDCTENFKAYKVLSHQHIPEIEQELSRLSGKKTTIAFTPHLVPMIRGIFSTIYVYPAVPVDEDKLLSLYKEFYRNRYFIRVLDRDTLPETRFVRGTNYCDLALKVDRRTGLLVIMSAIDNLVKGASGQAIQNMNINFGFPEETGLAQLAL